MKTFARFLETPASVKSGEKAPIRGIAQVGVSGLAKVQYWVHRRDEPLPADDEHFAGGDWREAEILPPPADWAEQLPGGLGRQRWTAPTPRPPAGRSSRRRSPR
jgi:hypothetical protein